MAVASSPGGDLGSSASREGKAVLQQLGPANADGTKVIPKLKDHGDLSSRVEFRITLERGEAATLAADLKQDLTDIGVSGVLKLTME